MGFGQQIREYGPKIHDHKRGTPTAGGIAILTALAFTPFLIRSEGLILLFATFGFGLVGLADDLIKFFKRRSLGLRARYKILLSLLVGVVFLLLIHSFSLNLPSFKVPFASTLELPWWICSFLVILVLISTVNAINLTDGLDGLACGTVIIILVVYSIITYIQGKTELLGLIIVLGGILLGFLWFNFYPAGIFLGDSGSFALGGFIGALALLTGTGFILPIIAFVAVIEVLSVIIQVISFKLFGIRVFKVSPLHHHFERAEGIDYKFILSSTEWPEPTITIRFWIVSAIFGLIGLLAYFK